MNETGTAQYRERPAAAQAEQSVWLIAWSQTEACGETAPDLPVLRQGTDWRWYGTPVQAGGPGALPGGLRSGAGDSRDVTLARVQALIAVAAGSAFSDPGPALDFLVTDGQHIWQGAVVGVPETTKNLVVFAGYYPPQGRGLHVLAGPGDPPPLPDGFAPGTLIATPAGLRDVALLAPGDLVETADCGPQPLVAVERITLPRAGLAQSPDLRPRKMAVPHGLDLWLGPGQCLLWRARAVRSEAGVGGALVRAADLWPDPPHAPPPDSGEEVVLTRLQLSAQQILFANGVEVASTHPALTWTPTAAEPADRAGPFVRPFLLPARVAQLRLQNED